MNHFFIPDDDDGAAGRRLLSALLSAADRAVADGCCCCCEIFFFPIRRLVFAFFFCAPSRTNTHKRAHKTSCFLFLSLQPADVSQADHRANRTERRNRLQQHSSFFHYSILVAIFNGVSALLPFTSRLFRTNTPPRRFFASI